MNYILFDDARRAQLLPLTFTRPTAEIRIGILTIRQKWEKRLDAKTNSLTQDYLAKKYPLEKTDDNILINGRLCPDEALAENIRALNKGEGIFYNDALLAARLDENAFDKFSPEQASGLKRKDYDRELIIINNLWDIFVKNGNELFKDFELLTKGRQSQPISPTNTVIGSENIFLEEGAKVEAAILNGSTGPIYIGKDAEVMEGSVVRGPLAMCEHSYLKLGAKIYGPTTIGPHSKIGGEVNNSVITGFSSKAHDGFLGNSVLGEWCNIGADSNNSNLKNNYAEVRLWNYPEERFVKTGQQFCGLVMGDHSKCGINTMFNTGTVVGVSANIFGAGFPRNFLPSFSWGGAKGISEYKFEKAMETAQLVMKRRGVDLDETEKGILKNVFEQTNKYRN